MIRQVCIKNGYRLGFIGFCGVKWFSIRINKDCFWITLFKFHIENSVDYDKKYHWNNINRFKNFIRKNALIDNVITH